MKMSITLQNCKSLDEVVKLINNGGTSEYEKDELAAQYILNAMEDNQDFSEESCMTHFDILENAGAKIDYADVRFEIVKINPEA